MKIIEYIVRSIFLFREYSPERNINLSAKLDLALGKDRYTKDMLNIWVYPKTTGFGSGVGYVLWVGSGAVVMFAKNMPNISRRAALLYAEGFFNPCYERFHYYEPTT
jgi:hypothetical protein